MYHSLCNCKIVRFHFYYLSDIHDTCVHIRYILDIYTIYMLYINIYIHIYVAIYIYIYIYLVYMGPYVSHIYCIYAYHRYLFIYLCYGCHVQSQLKLYLLVLHVVHTIH